MILVLLLGFSVALFYLLNNHLFRYWSKRGFNQLQPTFLFGNAGPIITLKTSMGEFFADLYSKHKNHKILGVYLSYRPVLVLTDAKIVQDIMIRDFTSFHDRPMPVDEANDPLSAHLFNISG
jgi:hypothetical protein